MEQISKKSKLNSSSKHIPSIPKSINNNKPLITSKSKYDLTFSDIINFRYIIISSLLSGKSVIINSIRENSATPGLLDYEINFLRLIDIITNGTEININEIGTVLKFKPGFLIGGTNLEHICCNSRGLGYYIEALIYLSPFSKYDIDIKLFGITNNNIDLSVDTLRAVTCRIVKGFGIDDCEIKVLKRGVLPLGGGEVLFKCGIVKALTPINWMEQGKFKKVRGLSFSCKVAPTLCLRMIDSSKAIFNQLLPDVRIFSDACRGKMSGLSPGFGCALAVESTTGMVLSSECVADGPSDPEELGVQVANGVLSEIAGGGCVDSSHQSLVLLFMLLTPEDISKVKFGKLTEQTIRFLRLCKDFFGVMFKVEEKIEEDEKCVSLTCRGIGFRNMARANC